MQKREGRSFAPPSLPQPDMLGAIRADLDAMLGRVALFEAEPDGSIDSDAVEVLARQGRELFTRRALEQAAEHATAMLPALGLPRLVGPGFAPFDRDAALDALDAAFAALDASDADPEAEPWLGWTAAGAIGAAHDAEHDMADAELDLGWAANHSQVNLGNNTPDGDLSALERHGRGFVRSGPDDAEEDDPLDDRTAEDSALRVWVFGPSRREAAYA